MSVRLSVQTESTTKSSDLHARLEPNVSAFVAGHGTYVRRGAKERRNGVWRCGNGGERRLDTRVGLGGGGSVAYAQPGYARAAGAQSSGRVCPPEPSPHPRRPRDRVTIERCKFANRPRARAASRDRSIEQESMMSEEKS